MKNVKINDYIRFVNPYLGQEFKYGQVESVNRVRGGNYYIIITELNTGIRWELTEDFIVVSVEEVLAAQILEEI